MRNAVIASGLSVLALVALGRTLTADIKDAKAADPGVPVQLVDDTTVQLNADSLANLELATVSDQAFPDVLEIMGTISVVENKVTSVPARVAGRIDSVMKVSGEFVKAGDALALEYSPDYITARQEYLEALDKDASVHASTPTAEGDENTDFANLAELTRKKLKNMGLSDEDIAGLASNPDTTHLVIRAQRDGVITAMNTTVGNMQNQGDLLITLSDVGKVWFMGNLYSGDLGRVHSGQTIIIDTGGLGKPVTGRLSFISPVIDPNAHTIKVRALIDNPSGVLRAGMVVQGSLALNNKTALVVPQTALLNLHNEFFCYKAVGQDRFKKVPVQVGREYGSLAEVLDGLTSGDQVVSAGGITLDQSFDGGAGD
jgi:Cu(I)/Ag(I) efflux system membrane fusion protein